MGHTKEHEVRKAGGEICLSERHFQGQSGGGFGEVYAIGNILRWNPRFPPPGNIYNLLPLRISRIVDVIGCHPSG